MNKKIIGIFICMLLIITALQAFGTMSKNITPNDSDFNKQWHLDNTGQTGGTPDADIDAPEAWEIETGNPNVVIAIIDSGIDYTHPDLVDNIWVNDDEIPNNGLDDDNNGYIDDIMGYNFMNNNNDLKDNYGHGTLIAGVIGAVANNGIGVAGICWNCKIMPVKLWNVFFAEEITITAFEKAIRYAADNGADVISMSFGLYEKNFIETDFIRAKEAINYTYGKGCILVASAGNDGISDPLYPAALENVIGVAGTDHNDKRMNFGGAISNYGDWVDVAAPAQNIYTTMTTYDSYNTERGFSKNYYFSTGTSFSGPMVAGVAALIKSRNPSYSQEEIMDIIKANVEPYNSTYYLGTGRINAYKALIASNVAPEKPTITGESSGKPGIEYEYSFISTDIEEDEISYYIDWGDNTSTDWTTTVSSGEYYNSSHTWSEEGDYIIKAKAKDKYGAESNWSTFKVSMPKTFIYNPIIEFFMRILDRFPFFEKILKQYL